ncbi:MAG: hypothetical protein NWP90_08230, partial [Flavobacterium sp.]|nr:hypothetical protein [Flavobacterium sp.]
MKYGIDNLLFGMKEQDVTKILGKPDTQYKDEEENVVFMYNARKLRLIFYKEEAFKLGYMTTTNPIVKLFNTTIIGKNWSDVQPILEKNKALKEGKLIDDPKTKLEINTEDWESIKSIISYLAERDRLTSLQDYLDVKLDTLLKPEFGQYQKETKVTELISKTFKNTNLDDFEKEYKYLFS